MQATLHTHSFYLTIFEWKEGQLIVWLHGLVQDVRRSLRKMFETQTEVRVYASIFLNFSKIRKKTKGALEMIHKFKLRKNGYAEPVTKK